MKNVKIAKKWRKIENVLGTAGMLSELFDYLDEKTITDFMEAIEEDYDIEESDDDFFRSNIDFERGMTCG